VVDAFQAALRAGDIDRAAGYLDPHVVILEGGAAEQSRDEYLAVHAPADAQFIEDGQGHERLEQGQRRREPRLGRQPLRVRIREGGQTAFIDSAETMVLRRDAAGWKIVHIHWSSHE
jgi:ketosteroid isomerase-like protein